MQTSMDKLYAAVAERGPVCVGLDTEISYLPQDFVDGAKTAGENLLAYNLALLDATKAVAGCYKVQIAYYEALGLDGLRAYAATLEAVREAGIPVIADIKRGDIAKTAEMYAKAHFTGELEADIITLAPYMGLDSLAPYLPYCQEQGKGVFDRHDAAIPAVGERPFRGQAAAVRITAVYNGGTKLFIEPQIERLNTSHGFVPFFFVPFLKERNRKNFKKGNRKNYQKNFI